MGKDHGASSGEDRAAGLRPQPAAQSSQSSIPSAGPGEPLRFGKYAGLSPAAVLRFDPQYLVWVSKNLMKVALPDSIVEAAKDSARKERSASFERQNAWAWGFGREARVSRDRLVLKRIKIEHEERRNAGQKTCHCFPKAWGSCPDCKGAGWVQAAQAMSARQGQDPQGLGAKPASAVGNADAPNPIPDTEQD